MARSYRHGILHAPWHATRRLFFRTKSVVFAEAEGWKKRSAECDADVDAKARFQADTDSNAEKRTTQSDDADLS